MHSPSSTWKTSKQDAKQSGQSNSFHSTMKPRCSCMLMAECLPSLSSRPEGQKIYVNSCTPGFTATDINHKSSLWPGVQRRAQVLQSRFPSTQEEAPLADFLEIEGTLSSSSSRH